MAGRGQLGSIQTFPYGSVGRIRKRRGLPGCIRIVAGRLSTQAKAGSGIAAVACKGLTTVAWAAVLASGLARLGAGGLVELRMERSYCRVNGKREGSRSVRVNCSPPHMKIRRVHGVGILVCRHRADGSHGGCCRSGLSLRIGGDGGINHGGSIFGLFLSGSVMVTCCCCRGSSGGSCDSDGIMCELVRLRSRRRWCGAVDTLGAE